MSAYASVILDVDSTLCGIEGIDWLASMRGTAVSQRVAELTHRAMAGEIPLDSVYGERLALVSPTWDSIRSLSNAYVNAIAPGANEALYRIRESGTIVYLVSGGIREAILPVATLLGIPDENVHAVSLQFADDGRYVGFDRQSPLATSSGKCDVVERIAPPRRVLAVGDGMTDLAMRPAVDTFAAYTGFVRRAEVADRADVTVDSFDQLTEIILA